MIDYRYLFAGITFSEWLIDKSCNSGRLYIGPRGTLTDDYNKRICDWIIR